MRGCGSPAYHLPWDFVSVDIKPEGEYGPHHRVTFALRCGLVALLLRECLREEANRRPLHIFIRVLLLQKHRADGILAGITIDHEGTKSNRKGKHGG